MKHMATSVATSVVALISVGFALRTNSKPHLAHPVGMGPCTVCGCQGFEGSSYICSNQSCHHPYSAHQ